VVRAGHTLVDRTQMSILFECWYTRRILLYSQNI